MKKVYCILIATVCLVSCNDVLDKYPLDMITDGVVWDNKQLVDAYIVGEGYGRMYILTNETPYSTSQNWEASHDWNGPFIINELADECIRNWVYGQSNFKYGLLYVNGGLLEWWENAYAINRAMNIALENLLSSSLEDVFKKSRMAEIRFLRAYNYFAMVKRYGGVPLITKVQQTSDPEEELYPSRAKEQDIYDFIIAEMDDIADDLFSRSPETAGRPTKWAAMALKCRAALYAASIAKFGTVQLGGIVGIEAGRASDYYQKACDAAQVIINDGVHSLYRADADKVVNFKNIFLVKNNPEAIWVLKHNYNDMAAGGNGWIWDFFQCPKPMAWGGGGNQNAPYLEMAESFEYIDGRPGTLDRQAIQEGLWTTEQLWTGKDPRFFASIWTHNTPWQGGLVDFHNGLLLPDGTMITSSSYEGVPAQGNQSVDYSFGSGFGVMKYLEESHSNMGERGTSGTDWQLFRFGEVLLNYAEAAFELGKTNEALDAVNQIRSRAGISLLTAIDREKIYHERKVELAFEGHRYWDLRRWRKAVDVLTVPEGGRGLRFILDYETRKYRIMVINMEPTSTPLFYERNYYFPITLTRTGINPKLVENPGY